MRKLLILMALTGNLAAQIPNVRFEVTQPFFEYEPLTNFLLGNLGLEGKDAATEVFRGTITNTGTDTVGPLYVHVNFYVSSHGDGSVYSSRSVPIYLLPGAPPLSFSSLDYFDVDRNSDARWGRTFTQDASATREEELSKLLDAGGRLPSGGARIELTLSTSPSYGATGLTDNVKYEVVNINELHLVSPGVPADGYDISMATIQNNTPQFSWLSDLLSVQYDSNSSIGSMDRFRIEIFELPDIEQLQEVLNNGVPVHTEDLELSVYPYPPGAAELRAGQLYAWRVRALLKSATLAQYDDDQMVSEPFVFRIADPAGGQEGGMSPEAAQAAGLLRVLLGEEYSYILKAIEGMEPEEIVYNNQVISMESLADTVYSLTGQGFTVEEIGVTNE